MTLQNRVMPEGEIVADPARGLVMGNRGILHDGVQQLGTARWRHPHWITCVIAFSGRKRPLMQPGAYTELFFLDEAVALAAGHRPCAECRSLAYRRFRAAWRAGTGLPDTAPAIDKALHAARVTRNRLQVRHQARLETLPDSVFVLWDGDPHLWHNGSLRRFTPTGYGPALPGEGTVTVLTPSPLVLTLSAGYRPILHPSLDVP